MYTHYTTLLFIYIYIYTLSIYIYIYIYIYNACIHAEPKRSSLHAKPGFLGQAHDLLRIGLCEGVDYQAKGVFAFFGGRLGLGV